MEGGEKMEKDRQVEANESEVKEGFVHVAGLHAKRIKRKQGLSKSTLQVITIQQCGFLKNGISLPTNCSFIAFFKKFYWLTINPQSHIILLNIKYEADFIRLTTSDAITYCMSFTHCTMQK